MTTTEKAHLKTIVKEILREDKNLLKEVIQEIFEENQAQKLAMQYISEQEKKEENFAELLENTSTKYKKVWEALA